MDGFLFMMARWGSAEKRYSSGILLEVRNKNNKGKMPNTFFFKDLFFQKWIYNVGKQLKL